MSRSGVIVVSMIITANDCFCTTVLSDIKWLTHHGTDVMIDESKRDVMTDVTVRQSCASHLVYRALLPLCKRYSLEA